MIHEGYIPYFQEWIKYQDSPEARTKADEGVQEVHSDIQQLAPSGSSKVGDSQNSPNQTTQHNHLEGTISDPQVKPQT